jgi:hypothetical protein
MIKVKRINKYISAVEIDNFKGKIEQFRDGFKYTVYAWDKEITGWKESKSKCLKEMIEIVNEIRGGKFG